MSPFHYGRRGLYKILDSLKRTRHRSRRRRFHYKSSIDDDDDITGAGRKVYGPLNVNAPGWDRASIDHLMSQDVPHQELAQPNVPAPDMTKDYVDRYFGFLPPNLLHNIINHEKSRRRQRIDTYFRAEHGRLPPRISKLLYGSFDPPQYKHKTPALTTASSAAAASVPPPPPYQQQQQQYYHSPSAVSPAASSVGSSLDELVRDLLNQENVQKEEIRSAENVVNEMDTFVQVLNSGMRELKDHLSTASNTPTVATPPQQDDIFDDEYLRSLLDDLPDFGEAPPSALASPAPAPVAQRYVALKKLGAPPSSPPPFNDDDDSDSSTVAPSAPLPMSQRIARKSMSNLAAASDTSSSPSSSASSSSRHEEYLNQPAVSDVHRLLRRVFREHATGQRNTQNATHKILDIAHNITKQHIH